MLVEDLVPVVRRSVGVRLEADPFPNLGLHHGERCAHRCEFTGVKGDTPQATAANDADGRKTLIGGMRIDHPSARSIALGK